MTRIKKYLKRKGFDFRAVEEEWREIKGRTFRICEDVTAEDMIAWSIWDELTKTMPNNIKHKQQHIVCDEILRKVIVQ